MTPSKYAKAESHKSANNFKLFDNSDLFPMQPVKLPKFRGKVGDQFIHQECWQSRKCWWTIIEILDNYFIAVAEKGGHRASFLKVDVQIGEINIV